METQIQVNSCETWLCVATPLTLINGTELHVTSLSQLADKMLIPRWISAY